MCKVFNCISENIDFANFIVTAILSLLLISATIIISWRQNKLQKNINNQQNQLQRNITERETKINLYQYRMNCYIQIMDALDIVCYGKLENYVVSFYIGGLEFVKKLSDGRKMMLKAYIESETIFDEEIAKYVEDLYSKYDALYVKSCDMLMVSDEERKRILTILIPKLGVTQNDSLDNVFVKSSFFVNTKEGVDFMKKILPKFEVCLALLNELKDVFQPNNELIKRMSKYINMSELNKI